MIECNLCGYTFEESEAQFECPYCGALFDGAVCEECGWPDVNQGWLGEEYG